MTGLPGADEFDVPAPQHYGSLSASHQERLDSPAAHKSQSSGSLSLRRGLSIRPGLSRTASSSSKGHEGGPQATANHDVAASLPSHRPALPVAQSWAGGLTASFSSSSSSLLSLADQRDSDVSESTALCHNPRCRKVLSLDPAFLEVGPSAFQADGFTEFAECYSDQLGAQGAGDPVRALFDACIAHTGILWPLCTSCARKACQTRNRHLDAAKSQLVAQRRALGQLGGSPSGTVTPAETSEEHPANFHSLATRSGDPAFRGISPEDAASELQDLLDQERKLLMELETVSQEQDELAQDAIVLQRAEMASARLESEYWALFGEFAADAHVCQAQQAEVCHALSTKRAMLESLVSTHTLNDAFHVWHDGHFGTINRFRLGRLPSQPVDWHELNAAWGLAAHLLYCVQKTLRVEFRAWKILPHGSFSRIQRRSDENVFELYGSSDISLGRLFWYRRFDQAMVGFLQCVSELGQYTAKRDRSRNFKLPHTIDKDRIGEGSIRSQFNNEEAWTKALKCTLTNLKYIVAFVTLDHASRARRVRAKREAALRRPDPPKQVDASAKEVDALSPREVSRSRARSARVMPGEGVAIAPPESTILG
jgi:Apg6 BARA domain